MSLYCLNKLKLLCKCLVHSCLLCNLCNSPVKNLNIRENKLKIDCLDISCRIYRAIYMDNVCILKAAHYVYDCIYLTDICKELVSKAFSFGCSLYKSCNIYEFNYSRCHFLRMIKVSEKLQSLIRHCNNTYIRVNGTERIVCRFRTCLCQRVK